MLLLYGWYLMKKENNKEKQTKSIKLKCEEAYRIIHILIYSIDAVFPENHYKNSI